MSRHLELLPDPEDQLAGVTAIGPNELNRAIGLKKRCQQALSRIPILDVGAGDHYDQHQAQRVDDQVTLGTVDLLAGIKASDFIAFGALDRLAIEDGRSGLGFAPMGMTELSAKVVVELDPEAAENPVAVVGVKDRPGREVLRHVAPLATCANDVENPIEDFAIRMFTRTARLREWLEEVIYEIPLFIAQIRGILYLRHSSILPTVVGHRLSSQKYFFTLFLASRTSLQTGSKGYSIVGGRVTTFTQERWDALWLAAGAKGDPSPWYERLAAAYGEQHRHYHNRQHIAECLREFDEIRDHCQNAPALEFAIWFHDAIYEPK